MTVTGFFSSDGQLVVEPGFCVDRRRREMHSEITEALLKDALVVEFVGKTGELLTQRFVTVTPTCCYGSPQPPGTEGAFASVVSYPAGVDLIRYYRRRELLKQSKKPAKHPVVRLTRAPGEDVGHEESVEWEVTRASDLPVRSILMFSHDNGETWQAIGPPSSSDRNSVRVRFADLPGGRIRLKAMVTDGFHTSSVECTPFNVPLKGVRPSILGPPTESTVPAGTPIWFHGQAFDYEKQAASSDGLHWRSSRDGELGSGPVIAALLSPGTHSITLRCGRHEAMMTIVAVSHPGKEPRSKY